MGRPRIKVIDTAIELEKIEKKVEKKLEISTEGEEKISKQAGAVKKTTPKERFQKKVSHSARYKSLLGLIDKNKEYPISQALDLVKKTTSTKFDSSVEVHINLNIDPTKSEQLIRKTINLPNGSGKTIRVLVFGGNLKELKNLGADIGTESSLEQIENGKINTDKIIATPDWMPKLAKVAKILGPKGLMPNPKSGTVTENPEKIVKDLQGGMIEVKTEKAPVIHTIVGKATLTEDKLEENLRTLISEIQRSKPEGLKKPLIRSVYLSSTMGPSVKLDISSLS